MTLAITFAAALAALASAPSAAAAASPLPGLLRPQASASRSLVSLDGVWAFRTESYPGQGAAEGWASRPLAASGPVLAMPVPSSYNDITQDAAVRDFVGVAWYETTAFVPRTWAGERVVLHFGSAHYYAQVFLDGAPLVEHDGGHLPFGADVTASAAPGVALRVTVALNNTLSPVTLPPGSVSTNNAGRTVQNVQMDFFNYAGIHRPVQLCSMPAAAYVDDVTVVVTLAGATAFVRVDIAAGGAAASLSAALRDAAGAVVASNATAGPGNSATLFLTVPNANLWWPFLMSATPAYLYLLEVSATDGAGVVDVYPLRVGLRTVTLAGTTLLLNGVPIYLRGFGKHEDAATRGKGMDQPTILKDSYLLQWFGANSFRTVRHAAREARARARACKAHEAHEARND